MTSQPLRTLTLPAPIATYFAADASDADAVARCFSKDAVVVDESRTHRGRADIARWKADATARYHYTTEPLSADTSGNETVVTGRVTGNFPGSPAVLHYRFALDGDAISLLEITV